MSSKITSKGYNPNHVARSEEVPQTQGTNISGAMEANRISRSEGALQAPSAVAGRPSAGESLVSRILRESRMAILAEQANNDRLVSLTCTNNKHIKHSQQCCLRRSHSERLHLHASCLSKLSTRLSCTCRTGNCIRHC
jgi:hypothetical protein